MENYPHKLSIKAWAEADRPREKLLSQGKNALSDAELIAIIIGSGTPNQSALDLSRKILSDARNSLYELGRFTVKDLMRYKGIGEAKAISILSAMELGRRRKECEVPEKPIITCSKDAAEVMGPLLGDINHEQFWVLYLNRSNQVTAKGLISSGGIAGTVVDTRLVFKSALENLATSIILCHNHPSGNKKPSESDISLTKKLKEAGQFMDVSVLDHIIIAGKNYFSFADEGIL